MYKMEPENFPFPFTPYLIQADFMKNLYKCLENRNLGIFESPTGTGKTLSIICGALKWLIDHNEREKSSLMNEKAKIDHKIKEIEENNAEDWFTVQTEKIDLNLEKQTLQKKLDNILKYEQKQLNYKEHIKQYYKQNENQKMYYNNKWRNSKNNEEKVLKEDNSLLRNDDVLEDLVLKDIDNVSDSSEEEVEEESLQSCKIFFCSRTHSQLSQFIQELKKSPYSDKVSVVPLASRNNYCINSQVKSLKNISMINERCQQLQKKKATSKNEKDLKRSKSATSCPYMPGDQSLLMAEILTSIRDIEDTVKISEELKTCPYYSTRKSLGDGQVILVPYNSVLHKSTRI